jgi:hypothetical protein
MKKIQENVDYELVPHDDSNDHWRVRILTGDYSEIVFQFTVLQPDDDGEHLKFNYAIVYSPIDIDEEDNGLQNAVGDILYQILSDIAEKL